MLPKVLNAYTTQFDSQGYGALWGCTKCTVTEELNGEYTLELVAYTDTQNVNRLIPRNIIVCKPNAKSDSQPFRIYKTKRSLDGKTITAYARHLSYDLNNYPCDPFSASYLHEAINELEWLGGDDLDDDLNYPFHFFTNMDATASFSIDAPKMARSLLMGSDDTITGVYGGEWLFDGWNCTLLSRRGKEDSGINIAYGNNLINYIKEANDEVVSGYIAFYQKDNVYIRTDVKTYDNTFTRIKLLDCSSEFQETPTMYALEQYIVNYERKNKSVDTLTIEGTPFLINGQTISLGDTVHITTDEITQLDLRVVKTIWDVLRDDYDKINLGSKKETIAATIKNLR